MFAVVRSFRARAFLPAPLIVIVAVAMTGPLPSRFVAQAAVLPELPRVFLDTTYVPPSGRTIAVPAGGDFQAALNAAAPGDAITLQAGATFLGPFTLPAKAGSGWIIVRSSAPDSSLAPPGSRITPAYAPLMPKIVVGSNAGGAIRTVWGAHHFRFIGVEFAPVSGAFVYSLIELGTGETSAAALPNNIIFDRCFIHGDPVAGGRRGIAMNSASTAVIDSYLSGFKEVGADSQALHSSNGTGPFKIVNNYLEAAGENVLFGGADPSIQYLVPSDIEVRGNHVFKPLSWRVGDPTYAGTHWSVKNLFELKNAQRVLVNGNIFEYNWADAQNGFSILFTVRNQDGTAPWSVVQDVTFTNNIVRHLTAGVNILGWDNLHPSEQTKRVLIQNNLFADVGGPVWDGGRLFQLLDGTADVVINHNTAFQTDSPIVASGQANTGFVLTNIITPNNQYGVSGDGTFGKPLLTLNTYFPGYVFARNVIVGGNPSSYPPDNFFPASLNLVGFIDLAGGDYHLTASSPYKNAGTDGLDIGANIDGLLAATANVISGNPPTSSDTTPPTVSITAPTAGTTVTGSITVSANAADNIGVAAVQFKLDGANLGAEVTTAPYAVSWNTTTATNAAHTLTAVARDAAGNVTTSLAVTVTVSNTASGSVAVSPTGLSFGSVTVGTTSAAQDVQITNTGPVGVSVSGATLTGPFTISQNYCLATGSWNGVMAPGTHCDVLVAFAPVVGGTASGTLSIGAAASVYAISLSGTGVPDTIPPSVSLTSPANGATVSGTITVSATASDNVGVVGIQFMLDGANLGAEQTAAAPYTVSWNTTTAANGTHTLTAIARDAAGNRTTSAPVGVTVNNMVAGTAPPVISSVAATSITSSAATIIWTTNEPADSQVLYGRNAIYNGVTPLDANLVTAHSVRLTGLAPRTQYHFRVTSRDAAGHLATSPDFTFKTAVSTGNTIPPTGAPSTRIVRDTTGAPALGAVAGPYLPAAGMPSVSPGRRPSSRPPGLA